jgi:hypothetical protein
MGKQKNCSSYFFASPYFLAAHLGPLVAFLLFAGFMAMGCSAAALLLKSAPTGKLTWRNRPAGYFLTFGFRLTNGKLLPITLVALALWLLAAAAAITALSLGPARLGLSIPLLAAWYLYAALIIRQLGLIFHEFRRSPRPRNTMVIFSLAMLALIAASAALWLTNQPRFALFAAAAPILIVGGGYGLFLAVFLVGGRKGAGGRCLVDRGGIRRGN